MRYSSLAEEALVKEGRRGHPPRVGSNPTLIDLPHITDILYEKRPPGIDKGLSNM